LELQYKKQTFVPLDPRESVAVHPLHLQPRSRVPSAAPLASMAKLQKVN